MNDLFYKDGVLKAECTLDTQGNEYYNAEDNPEYIKVVTDDNGRILYGVRKNGEFVWAKGILATDVEKQRLIDDMSKYPTQKYLPLMASLKRTVVLSGTPDTNYETLNIATLADIHNGVYCLENFMEFVLKYKKYINDSIVLGDIAGTDWKQYDNLDDVTGYRNVLKVLGNHDNIRYSVTFTVTGVTVSPSIGAVYKESSHTHTVAEVNIVNGEGTIKCIMNDYDVNSTGTLIKIEGEGDDTITFTAFSFESAPVEKCFERYFSNIENWGVHYETNKCYYYKDYELANIRLIVLDCIHITNEQKEWLQYILMGNGNSESALALGLHVVIAQHIPIGAYSDKTLWDCNFTSYDLRYHDHESVAFDAVKTYVDNFQKAGGIFVTYMFGHYHVDEVGTYEEGGYPDQTFIVYANGKYYGYWKDTEGVEGTDFDSQFTITSIDTRCRLIRLLRIGATYNRHLMHRESIVISYADGERKIVSQY